MSKLIFIAGAKRSGKDTFGALLKDAFELQGKSVELISFAGPMKQILSITLGVGLNELDAAKNNPDLPHRGYLQRLGTEAMKPIFGDDVWTTIANKAITESSADYVIITDFRFPEEYYGCIQVPHTIRVERQSVTPAAGFIHISEYALKDFAFNTIVNNNNTLDALGELAIQFVNKRINT